MKGESVANERESTNPVGGCHKKLCCQGKRKITPQNESNAKECTGSKETRDAACVKKEVKESKDHTRTNVTLSVRYQALLVDIIPRMNFHCKIQVEFQCTSQNNTCKSP